MASVTEKKKALWLDLASGNRMHPLTQELADTFLKKPALAQSDTLCRRAKAEGITPQDMQLFLRFFARGMEWAHQQSPHVGGPDDIVFGNAGEIVHSAKLGKDVPIQANGVLSLVTIARSGAGTPVEEQYVIAVPFAEIKDMLGKKGPTVFEAQARRHLGPIGREEGMFLAGVEEYYHAVQKQDPQVRQRLEAQSNTVTTAQVGLGEHDTRPNELDVVPILQQGLAFCRQHGVAVDPV